MMMRLIYGSIIFALGFVVAVAFTVDPWLGSGLFVLAVVVAASVS